MAKKILSILIILTLAAALCACGYVDVPEGDADGDVLENVNESNGGEETPAPLPQEPEPETPEEPEPPVEPEPPAPTVETYLRASSSGLNIRSGPGSGYASLGKMDKGDLLAYLGKEGGWYKTVYKNRTAYVSASLSTLKTIALSAHQMDALIEFGKAQLGYPYIYGAERYHWGNGVLNQNFDSTKFDCSSLMQYMFKKVLNVNLGTTSRAQAVQGTAVARTDIQRGDLLFFTNASRKHLTGIERVGHVALYLGDNYILHTASDFAVIEEITAARWGNYLFARRIGTH